MARRKSKRRSTRKATRAAKAPSLPLRLRLRWWIGRGALALAVFVLAWLLLYRFVNPPFTPYILSETWRTGERSWSWTRIEDLQPHVPRAFVAAEDANFCNHWGFDMAAIRAALDEGSGRGASTISQQVAKNVYLWHGRSWLRKGLEAGFTIGIEALWPKWRILEVYMNVAEFDEGVFGVDAAARHYFRTDAPRLTRAQAARLAAILPDPKGRSASAPSDRVRARARAVLSGADTIAADGRSACFED